MEYYIYLTYNCNLSCSYCSVRKVLSSDSGPGLTDSMIDKLIKYISKNNHSQKDTVVFFGGEPLLEYQIIDNFIRKASGLNLSYILYTNGLLLNNVPLTTLNSLDIIFISIDGDKRSHEKHRGIGTYEKIINNIKEIKPKLNSFVIGRITAEEETDIYSSVTNIIDSVDAVYWQIVNKPKFNNADVFIEQYKQNLNKLFEFWLYNFKQGKILNIIPFQVIISSLIFNYQKDEVSFSCGAGSNLQSIDLNGNIYWCDEYVGDPKGIIGNINSSKPVNLLFENHRDIFEDCKECDVKDLCLGRCKKCLKEYSDKQIRVYCNLTKHLVKIILGHIDDIKRVMDQNNYTLKDFYNGPYCTEEIP